MQLPDARPGETALLILKHANPDIAPVNRDWLPLGPYLRHAGGVTALPQPPTEVTPSFDKKLWLRRPAPYPTAHELAAKR